MYKLSLYYENSCLNIKLNKKISKILKDDLDKMYYIFIDTKYNLHILNNDESNNNIAQNILLYNFLYLIIYIPKKYNSNISDEFNKCDLNFINIMIYDLKKNNVYDNILEYQCNYIENIYLDLKLENKLYLKNIKIISILDQFSNDVFTKDCKLFPININNWLSQFKKVKPSIFFVESVWNAVNCNINLSKYSDVTYKLIITIITYCRNNNIKTVFWNKEDGINYNKFIWVAKLFDFIYTTDNNCLKNYEKDAPNSTINTLQFAITPKLHNPFNKKIKRDVLFAGKWYHSSDFIDRRNDMKMMFEDNNFLKKIDIDIYDRDFNIKNKKKSFPDKYNLFLKEAIEYKKLCALYKTYIIMYNTNSVNNSNTMFSRRVFESIGCKTFILSTFTPAYKLLNLNSIFIGKSSSDFKKYTEYIIQNYYNLQNIMHADFLNIYKNHKYSNRLKNICDDTDIIVDEMYHDVICISEIDNTSNIKNIISIFNKQNYQRKKLLLLHKNNDISKITLINLNTILVMYTDISELYKFFNKNTYVFILSPNIEYKENYIENYILNYLYIKNNYILCKSIDIYNSNKIVKIDNVINDTISFISTKKNIKNYFTKNKKQLYYAIDCYDYKKNF